nr:reverse transcriptase domain-containing protein [Tanacetum cinerariifolium]
DYLSKWVEAKALPTNDARVVVKFLKSLFARFGTPRAIISDRGTYFCNDKFVKVMSKYGVIHRLATAYHPQTSRQVEVSNQGLKRILERTVGENRASWFEKLEDALWAFRTAYKTPIGCTPYKLVYGKSCHLPIELKHKAYWALKHVNFDLKTMDDHQMLQLNELRDQAYENSLTYKEKTKKLHDAKMHFQCLRNQQVTRDYCKGFKNDEKEALLKVLKSHTQAIAWKITGIKGIDPRFRTHKILMEEDYKPEVQSKIRVNPKIHEIPKTKRKQLSHALMELSLTVACPSACVMLPEFDITIRHKKGSENLTANHLSRLENPHKDLFENKDINENFPLETLGSISSGSTPWFADIANFHARNFIKKGLTSQQKNKFFKDVKHYFWDDPHLFRIYGIKSFTVEVSNRGLKRILERTIGENRASWSDKLDDALWAFRTVFKTPIGCTPYKQVYEKSCHLPIELEHKAYWALKHPNFDLKTAGDHRKLQLNELNELRDQAYENSLIYKERTKKLHDSKIKNRIFNVGDQVLFFNSRLKILSGKLKTRWSGPYTIAQVFPYGTVELS